MPWIGGMTGQQHAPSSSSLFLADATGRRPRHDVPAAQGPPRSCKDTPSRFGPAVQQRRNSVRTRKPPVGRPQGVRGAAAYARACPCVPSGGRTGHGTTEVSRAETPNDRDSKSLRVWRPSSKMSKSPRGFTRNGRSFGYRVWTRFRPIRFQKRRKINLLNYALDRLRLSV